LFLALDEVLPREPGCDPGHSEHDGTDEHDGSRNRDAERGVPLPKTENTAQAISQHSPFEGANIPPPRRKKGGGGKRRRREPLQQAPAKEDTLSLVGRVVETFPSSTFKVELENGHTILASLAGRLRRFRIRITPGDDVDVELSPYDLTRGRITYRRQGRNA
jgi:translation initiation factor IF-1